MAQELAIRVIERHRRRRCGRARRITIDLDPTDDATHGAQQLTFFNGYYDSWCYLPLLAFVTFDDEAEQYLAAAVLRPGNVPATQGAVGVLRLAFPQARFLVRLDGGFATPEIFDVMAAARVQSEESGETEHGYTDVGYAARTWGRERRVVIKAEVVRLAGRAPQDNPRFVVTNCARRRASSTSGSTVPGATSKTGSRNSTTDSSLAVRVAVASGRINCACSSPAAAYVLMQELRLRAARTACARTQVTWLRDRLLKLGAHVVGSARRIVLHLPTATPDLHAWRRIALALGARPG